MGSLNISKTTTKYFNSRVAICFWLCIGNFRFYLGNLFNSKTLLTVPFSPDTKQEKKTSDLVYCYYVAILHYK